MRITVRLSTENRPHDRNRYARYKIRMKPAESLWLKINARMSALGMNARQVSLSAGLKPDAVRTIKQGKMPSADKLVRIANILHCTPSDLIEEADLPERNDETRGSDDPAGYVGIPTMGTRAGMGGGGFGDEDMLNGPTMLPERLIRTELRGEPTDFVVMEVEGQSMQPVLESGDQVLVDRRKKNPSNGGLFALWDGFGIVVKWVERVANSNPAALRIASENKVFQPYEILAEEANIIGRIVWFARKL